MHHDIIAVQKHGARLNAEPAEAEGLLQASEPRAAPLGQAGLAGQLKSLSLGTSEGLYTAKGNISNCFLDYAR